MPTYEIEQAVGANARTYTRREVDWGNLDTVSYGWKELPLVPGERMQENIQRFESRIIRRTRSRSKSLRGTRRPGGPFPFELGPIGVNELLWHLLGGSVTTSGSGPYTHTIKGSDTLPEGFSMEKAFTDVNAYMLFLGCRVNSMTLNFAIDQPVNGVFNILARSMENPAATSAVGTGTPASLIPDVPYKTNDIVLTEGDPLAALATCNNLVVNIDNRFNDANFVLGNNYRATLKPGQRLVTVNGTLLFNNYTLYNKARNGTATKLQVVCSDGTNSHTFLFPAAGLFDEGSTPSVESDQGIEIPFFLESTYDGTEQTDVKVTMVTTQASITG